MRLENLPEEPSSGTGTDTAFLFREKQTALTELRVLTIQREQLLVIAALNNFTSLQDKDQVGMPDGRKPVCDHETCPTQQ